MQFDQLIVDAAINRWHHCVSACVHVRGKHFEHRLCKCLAELSQQLITLLGTYVFCKVIW